ncbi:MAG: hypothetical protein KatS3mg026_1268 [Bacteroidia bacterium]|nr:MAG: hypothetical protein KatS3mg026_1268 [Bacteroidia bacterium]
MRYGWILLVGVRLGAQGLEPLRDSLLLENERIEALDLAERPWPVVPLLSAPAWPVTAPRWEGLPTPPFWQPTPLSPTRPTWTRLAPLHVRYDVGRFWTQRLAVGWNRTRDLARDEGLAFSHASTPVGHVPQARWGHTFLHGWWGRYTPHASVEVSYRGGYEKFRFYAPYAERWSGFSESTPVPDTLRGHYWRQELTVAGQHQRWGRFQLASRRLDLTQGAPEWQASLEASSRRYTLPASLSTEVTFTAFVEGQRYALTLAPCLFGQKGPWQGYLGFRVGIGQDTRARFLLAPLLRVLYSGLSPAFQPYVESTGDLRPVTYYGASELNPYLRRTSQPLPLTREGLRAELGVRGQGAGWEYRLAGEYRLAQGMLQYVPQGPAFILGGLDRFQSVGLVGEGRYLPLAQGPYVEAQGAYRSWTLPAQTLYYSMSPWEVTLKGGYRWEERAYIAASVWVIGPRHLTDTLLAPTFVDISWETHLRLWPFLSFFVQMNNLLNKPFYRWYGYRERPLDFRFGFWLKVG